MPRVDHVQSNSGPSLPSQGQAAKRIREIGEKVRLVFGIQHDEFAKLRIVD